MDYGSDKKTIETVVALLKETKCKCPSFFDVGSNVGLFAKLFMRNFNTSI